MTTTSIFVAVYTVHCAVTGVLAVAVFLLLREHGRSLMLRGANRADQGPRVGSSLPQLTLRSFEGMPTTIGNDASRASIVLIAGATCPACLNVAPELGRVAKVPGVKSLVVCLGGNVECAQIRSRVPDDVECVVDEARTAVKKWSVLSTPLLLAISPDGRLIGKTSAVDRAAVAALHEALAKHSAHQGAAGSGDGSSLRRQDPAPSAFA